MSRSIGPSLLKQMVGRPDGPAPAYMWLADRIEHLVADGRLLYDTRLPGERHAAVALGLSRTTVSAAYARLRERGFAEARQGSGTRIRIPGGRVPGGGEPLAGVGDASPSGPEAERLIDLTSATPPAITGLSEHYQEALGALAGYTRAGGYYRDGIPTLREAIARRYTDRGVATTPDQILVTTGALAGVVATSRALVRRGDRVSVDAVGYPNSFAALRQQGVRLLPRTSEPAQPRSSTAEWAGVRAALVMPDFHNPTGTLLDNTRREALADAWREHDVIGIVDETLVDLWWEEAPRTKPMAAFAPERTVSIGSASKSYWGGLRLGWVRVPHKLFGAVSAARLTLDLGAPVLEQLVLTRLVNERPGLEPQRRAQLAAARHMLRDTVMARCPGWTCDVPPGGLCLWWSLPTPASAALASKAAGYGLSLSPGSTFAFDGRGLAGRLRTPFTLPPETLREAADALGDLAQGAGALG